MSPLLKIVLLLLSAYSPPRSSGDNGGESFFETCPPTKCSKRGPTIRYPLRLNTQPSFCGREGSELSCSANGSTLFHLPFSGSYLVDSINYYSRRISLEVQDGNCPLQSLLSMNRTDSIFEYLSTNLLVVNCTRGGGAIDGMAGPIDCLQNDKDWVYVTDASATMDKLPSNCSISGNGAILFDGPDLVAGVERILRTRKIFMYWRFDEGCNECERKGNYCGINTSTNGTICMNPRHPSSRGRIIIGLSVGGTILLALVIIFLYRRRTSINEKETWLKIEKFLANYKTLNPTRYTFSEIKKMTGRFNHRIGQGGQGSVYQGKLPSGIPVAVKMLENPEGNGEQFINEMAAISRIHHSNVVRLLGFCYEGTRRAIVYEFMPNGSLERFICLQEAKSGRRLLNWEQLHKIAIGIAHGIEYLHQGCNQRILHFDIKPHNILLDHNFCPKISDFGLAKLCARDQSVVSMTGPRGTAGYTAPELFSRNFGEVSYKSDVYSYGMLLLELVGSRRRINFQSESQSQTQVYFPIWIYERLSLEKDLELQVEMDGDEEIAKKMAIVALWCIQWSPKDRPSMTMVIQKLEGDSQSIEMPPKPYISSDIEIDS